jgi:ribosomal protein S12 methylthiotransferase
MKTTQNPQKIYLLSLGCPRNLVDSELILSRLKLKNHRLVDIDQAQTVIVNTCGFIKEAKQESIDALLDLIELKKKGKIKKIIAYGCLVERYAPELVSALKGVDAFVGRLSLNHTKREIYLTPRHYAYLKISEGCKNACSFCVIPKIKGKFVSRCPQSLMEEVKAMEQGGVVEINIIGQDVTLYGDDLAKKDNLVSLIKQILKNANDIAWIRLLYLYPSHISDELLELIAGEPRICKYIDLPLQHINNRILRLMNRRTTREEILSLISKIRNKIPGVAIRSSLLVGFPTETDEEFNELLNFVEDIEFERLGVFIYSPEEGTPAFKIKPQVSSKIKQTRFQTIMLKQQDISSQVNKRFLGKTIRVLVDDRQGEDFLGRSPYDAPEVDGLVFLKSRQPLKIGEFKKVKIIDSLEYDLVGEVI